MAGRTTGYMVDRFRLLDVIGEGGMGRVYLARDTRLDRFVALKILSTERLKNPRALTRFHREARVGALLQHENLVRIYDFGESDGRPFLVMEYIEGKTIGTLISERGPVPPAAAARLASQVAHGLEHAHRKGMIHRDVNPFNILVTQEGTAKLADMGLALSWPRKSESHATGRRSARSTMSHRSRRGTHAPPIPVATSIRWGARCIICAPAWSLSPSPACPRSFWGTSRSTRRHSPGSCPASPRD